VTTAFQIDTPHQELDRNDAGVEIARLRPGGHFLTGVSAKVKCGEADNYVGIASRS
jgi:hypothetical protein